MKHRHTPCALNDVAQGYLPRRVYRGRCAIHTSHPSLWFFVASLLGFEMSSAWTSIVEYASDMAYLFPHTWFGPQLKHAKGVDMVMGYIESLLSYPHYWKYYLVPHLMIGKINLPSQLSHGWTCHQAVFFHSDLGGSPMGSTVYCC